MYKRQVETGDFEVQIKTEKKDEMGQLIRTFNYMVREIHKLVHVVSVSYTHLDVYKRQVVYNPYTEELYTAVKGEGAYKNGKRIHSSEKGLGENLAAFGCARYNSNDTSETDRIFRYAKILYLHTLAIRSSGSAALEDVYKRQVCKECEDRNTSAVRANLQQWGCMEQEKSGAKTEVGSMG